MHLDQIFRGALPVHEDHRASTHSCKHVGKDQTVKQLYKSTGAGKPAGHVRTAVRGKC